MHRRNTTALLLVAGTAFVTVAAVAQQARNTPAYYLVCEGVAPAIVAADESGNVLPRRLRAGENELSIPANGLARDARFRLSQVATDTVRVDLEMTPKAPFRRPARLVISLERCTEQQIRARNWAIWRFEEGVAPQRLPTVINPGAKRAMADIDGNSRYLIAD